MPVRKTIPKRLGLVTMDLPTGTASSAAFFADKAYALSGVSDELSRSSQWQSLRPADKSDAVIFHVLYRGCREFIQQLEPFIGQMICALRAPSVFSPGKNRPFRRRGSNIVFLVGVNCGVW